MNWRKYGMFEKLKKVFTVLAVLTVVASSTPLTVLADVLDEPVTTQTDDKTASTETLAPKESVEADLKTANEVIENPKSTLDETLGANQNANAPNENEETKAEETTSKEEKSKLTDEEIEAKNNASGLDEGLIDIANQYHVDVVKISQLASRERSVKYNTTGLTDDEIRVLGLFLFGLYARSGDYAQMPNDKGEMIDIPFIIKRRVSRGTTSSTSFPMNYTLRHRTGAVSNFNRIGRQYIDGKPAFCIDPTADFLDNRNYTQFVADNNSDWWNINAYMVFGDDSSDKNHGYLQLMIWEQLGWTVTGVGSPGSIEEYRNYRTAVQSTIENFKTKASFHGETFEVRKGQTITPIDRNGVINKMGLDPHYSAPAGIQLAGGKNPISITVPANYSGPDTVEFHMLRGSPTGQFDRILRWEMPGGQPGQPVVTSGPVSPLYNDTMFRVHIVDDETPPTEHLEDSVKFRKVDESGNGLSGARFKVSYITGSRAGQFDFMTSGYDGYVTVEGKRGDKLKVEEISAPDGYIIDSTPQTITIDGSTNTYRFVNREDTTPPPPSIGYAFIYKEDERGNKLQGARFKVEVNGVTGYETTGASGMIMITGDPGDRVRVTEVQAPDGYILSNEVKEFTLDAGNDYSYTFVNREKPKEGTLILKKEDAETGNTAQGKASLNGAVYELRKKGGEVFKTITFDGVNARVEGIPFGEYELQEKTAPKGYNLNPTVIPIIIEESTQEIIVNKTVTDTVIKGSLKGLKFGTKDIVSGHPNVALGGVELTVTSKTTGKKYVTVTQDNGSFEINNLPYDDYRLTETKGIAGYRLIAPFDFTINTNGQVATYHLEDKTIENRVKIIKKDLDSGRVIAVEGTQFKIYDRVTKKFITNGNSDILSTTKDGYVITANPLAYGKDRYEVREIQAPKGYVLSTDAVVFSVDSTNNDTVIEVNFTNKLQKGRVKLKKTVETATDIATNQGSNGNYTLPTFTQQAGVGFKFKIKAMEDIVAPDGTRYYTKGEFIQNNGQDIVLTTNENGEAISPELFYIGKYALVEVFAPAGVVLDTTEHAFEIEYAGQMQSVSTKSVALENYLQSINIVGTKQEEILTGWKDGKAVIDLQNATSGQVFALKNAEAIQVGDKNIPADTILGYATVQNGKLNFANLKLPGKATKLYIQEVFANNDYVLDGDKYGFTYTPTNDQTVTIQATENPIVNKLAKAQVALYKFDKAQHIGKKSPISNVAFDLFNVLNGKEVKVGTYRTDSNGYITVSDLPTGQYFFKEAAVPAGYVALTEKTTFNVDATTNGKRIDLEVENKRLPIEIGTQATFANGAKVENPYKELTLTDTVSMKNLIVGKEYILHAKLIEFGQPNKVIKEFDTKFTASALNQNVTVTTKVDGTALIGKKVTFMETLLDGEVTTHVWAEHNNPNDEGQSVRITNPQIGTQATFENGLKELNPFKENKLVDTIAYTDLVPNRTYTIKSKLVEYGNAKNVIHEAAFEFTPTTSNGTHKIQVTVDGTKLRGKKVTFLEYLSDKGKPTEELAKHENPKDEGQSVRITNPQISTQAHFEDGSKEFLPLENVKIVDTVKYNDLTPNRAYTLKAKLIEYGNPTKVIGETTAIFTPTAKNGETKVTLTVDGTKLRGKKVTFLEYLYDNEKPKEEQARHENPKDDGQSVTFTNPEIHTNATFENEAKVSNPYAATTIYDTVSYTGLIANRKYNLHAVLVHKATGKVIQTKDETFTPTASTGAHRLSLVVDGTQLRGAQVVFFEYLTDVTQPKTELAKHEDINDEGQTVTFTNPQIGTKATFENGAKVMNPFKENVLVDTISYSDLVAYREYRIVTKLVEYGNAKNVIATSENTFTPTTGSGEYKVSLKVDGTTLKGKKVVFLEYLYDGSEEIAKHEDDTDEGQSVEFTNPKIGTQATFENGLKVFDPFKQSKLVDTMAYEGLAPGRKYRVVTKLVVFGNKEEVIQESEDFFKPEKASGEYRVKITVDGSKLKGKKVVFLEYLYDAEKPEEELTSHEDDKDEGQSVEFTNPSITTKATSKDGKKVLDGLGKQVVTEWSEIKGLVVGQTYKVKVQGYVNGKALKGTFAEKVFKATKETMILTFDFTVNGTELAGKELSFEERLESQVDENTFEEITTHNTDHKDKDQSVTFKETPKQKIEKKVQQLMKTGSKTTTAIVVLGLILILMSVIIFAFLKTSKRS